MSSYQLFEAEVGSNERERNRDSKPESKQSDQSAKRNGDAAAFDPQDQIQYKEHGEHNPKTTQFNIYTHYKQQQTLHCTTLQGAATGQV